MRDSVKIFNQTTVLQGLVAGLMMALFLSFLSVTGEYGTGAVKYVKYLLLLGVIGYSLYTIRAKRNENQFLLSSIKKGFAISLIGGIVVTVVNFLLFLYSPSYSIEKFNLAPDQLTELHLINAALIVEIVVIGLIGTFVLYQGLKYREVK